jgi:integrase
MLKDDVKRYIELKYALGFKYRVQASLLNSFANFSKLKGDRFVRTQTVLSWAAKAPSTPQRRNRLLTIRRFAKAIYAEDKRHQIPPDDAFGHQPYQRRMPHIFSPEELAVLLNAASDLEPNGSIRPAGYTTLFSLIAATGLRISESLALQIDDMTEDGLLIRSTKFRKSRLVPIHETVRCGLNKYLTVRERIAARDNAVFVSLKGTALCYSTVNHVFLNLVRSIGLRKESGCSGPRIHDLRHTFAVRSLENCKENREEVARHLVALSTYLGHTHVTDTYWYLQATPKLMNKIATANELVFKGGQS